MEGKGKRIFLTNAGNDKIEKGCPDSGTALVFSFKGRGITLAPNPSCFKERQNFVGAYCNTPLHILI